LDDVMKKRIWLMLLAVCLLAMVPLPVSAQSDEFGIRLRRDFGYGAGSNVRGTFTISLVGDEARVEAVEFLIDGEVMASIAHAPFRFQFHTDRYGFGPHHLAAKVYLQDGTVNNTQAVRLNFISPEDERSNSRAIFLGIGGVLVLGMVVYGLIQWLVVRKTPKHVIQPGELHQYGLLGATICPKCGRPFPRHICGINLGVGKFDRCEHCGKWSMTTRATPEAVRAAETAVLEAQQADQEAGTVKGQVKDALEDTRYIDEI
jgi:hypothetical protein